MLNLFKKMMLGQASLKKSLEKDYKITPPTNYFAFIGFFRKNDSKFYSIALGKVYIHPPDEPKANQPVGGIVLLVFLLILTFESFSVIILYFV